MGIRDIGCFNQALLAKQARRLIKEPDSLFARVLIGKYCWGKIFLDCTPKSGCSWGWRSILWGKALLGKGLTWRLGNGQHISVFGHQWIPKACNPYLQNGRPMGVCNFKVSNLIDWQRFRRRRPLIRQLFPSALHQKIFVIHISRRRMEDEFYWMFARDGKFSVKLAYFVAGRESFDSFVDNGRGVIWKKIWSLNLNVISTIENAYFVFQMCCYLLQKQGSRNKIVQVQESVGDQKVVLKETFSDQTHGNTVRIMADGAWRKTTL